MIHYLAVIAFTIVNLWLFFGLFDYVINFFVKKRLSGLTEEIKESERMIIKRILYSHESIKDSIGEILNTPINPEILAKMNDEKFIKNFHRIKDFF